MPSAQDDLVQQVSAHLIDSLRELATGPADGWDEQLAQLCRTLAEQAEPDALLPAVVQASAVIQQFLLELATRPSNGYPLDLVVHEADWLLRGGSYPHRPSVPHLTAD